VSAYHACSKLFAAPSIERERPVSVSIPSCSHARTAMWPGIPIKIKKNSYYKSIYHSNRRLLIISVNPHFSKKSIFFKFKRTKDFAVERENDILSEFNLFLIFQENYFLFFKRIISYFSRELSDYSSKTSSSCRTHTFFDRISSILRPKTKNEIAVFSRNFQDLKVPSSTYPLAEWIFQ
jgi:hypothetical protein